jgi:hypothetical protein
VARKSSPDEDRVLAELRQIKALLVLLLLKAGSDSFEIAKVTGLGSSTIRRDFPAEQVRPFGAQGKRRGAKG